MEFVITDDYSDMSRVAADIIAQQIRDVPTSVLGLATGSTPIGTYDALVEDYDQRGLDFSQVTTFNLDEYAGLSEDDPQSYRYFMDHYLFDRVNIDKANTHVPSGTASDVEQMCAEYEKAIRNAGGIDLQLLGLGHNGHIGFNEPDDEFPVNTHVVDLTERTIQANSRLFDSADQVPRRAYTMGIGTIMRARKILVVANGEDKADIVARAFTGSVLPQVPASVLQLHPDVTVVCDAQAAGKLKLSFKK